MSGWFGAQCSVAPVTGQQFKDRVGWVCRSSLALVFTLEGYSSGPRRTVTLSAVLTLRCSLLMSVLGAEPNQTVIDEHRTVCLTQQLLGSDRPILSFYNRYRLFACLCTDNRYAEPIFMYCYKERSPFFTFSHLNNNKQLLKINILSFKYNLQITTITFYL